MKLYWTVESIPELAPLAPRDRTRVWRACVRRSFTHWQTWAGILLMPLCGHAPAEALERLLVWLGMRPLVTLLFTVPLVGVGSAIGVLVLYQIMIAQTRPYVRAYLAHAAGAPQQGDQSHPAAGRDDPPGHSRS